jgi:hypothetical protein
MRCKQLRAITGKRNAATLLSLSPPLVAASEKMKAAKSEIHWMPAFFELTSKEAPREGACCSARGEARTTRSQTVKSVAAAATRPIRRRP